MRNGFKKWDRKITGVKDDNVSTKEEAGGWIGPRDWPLALLYGYWKGFISWGEVLDRCNWSYLSTAERGAWWDCIDQNFGGNTVTREMGLRNADRYWDREAGEPVSRDTLRERQARRKAASVSSRTRASAGDIMECSRLRGYASQWCTFDDIAYVHDEYYIYDDDTTS